MTGIEVQDLSSGFGALIQRFLGLPFIARLAVSIAVSALGGLGVGIISEYAAYSYAIHLGLRPPFEGIPYLKATVGAFATCLVLGLFLSFAVIYYILRLPLTFTRDWLSRITELSQARAATDQSYAEAFLDRHKFDSAGWRALARIYGFDLSSIKALILSGAAPSVVIAQLGELIKGAKVLDPAIPIRFASVSAVIVVFVMCMSLFEIEIYRKLLCTMNYGGGIPVGLQIPDGDSREVIADSGRLAIRSTSSITIQRNGNFREYPLASVRAIDYSATFSCQE